MCGNSYAIFINLQARVDTPHGATAPPNGRNVLRVLEGECSGVVGVGLRRSGKEA